MYKLLEKIRRQPENVRKTIAASIVAILMGVIGWTWILTMKNNFDFHPDTTGSGEENVSVISPLEALKENFAAIKELSLKQKTIDETKPENKNIEFFENIKHGLDKSWHWAYDPLKK